MRRFQFQLRVERLPLWSFLAAVAIAPIGRAQEPPSTSAGMNRLAGRVWTPEKKTPAAQAYVTAVAAEGGFLIYSGPSEVMAFVPGEEKVFLFFAKPNASRSGSVLADSEGRFAIDGLKPGKYHVLAVHGERGMTLLRDVEQPTTGDGMDLVLDPPTFLEGKVAGLSSAGSVVMGSLQRSEEEKIAISSGDGRPTVIVNQPRFEPSADGTFRVGPIPSGGQWTLEIQQMVPSRKFSAPLLKRPVTLTAGVANRLDVDLGAGSRMTGRVLGPSDEALADVAVSISTTESDEALRRIHGAITDAEGRYVIGGLTDGAYRLDAKRWLPRTGFG